MQVQNNKEEVPFAHYEEKFRALDPIESAKRCGVPFADGKFSVRLLGVTYQITWPDYAITADRDGAVPLLYQVECLSGGTYRRDSWAAFNTTVTYDQASSALVLTSRHKFAGRVTFL